MFAGSPALVPDWALAAGGGASGLPSGYVNGAKVTYLSVTQVQIQTGSVRDSTDAEDIVITAARTADITVTGAGGRNVDTAEQASTWYAIFIIDDSTGTNPEAAFLVNQNDLGGFTMPVGYDILRRLGWVYNDSNSDLRQFEQVGTTRDRWNIYTEVDIATLQALSAGSAVVWTDINLAVFMPPTSRWVYINCDYNGFDSYAFRPNGSAIATPVSDVRNGATQITEYIKLFTDATQIVEYQITVNAGPGELYVYVYGWFDEL